MPFETRQHEGTDPALTPAVAVSAGPWSRRLLGGVDRRVAVVAILVAVGLISGLTWNLISTQSKARASLDDSIQRRAALTADLISSAFMSARTPAVAQAQFGGGPDALRRAVRSAAVAAQGQRVTVLDARGRVLAAAGGKSDPNPAAREDVRLALRGTPSLSDAYSDGRRGRLVELAAAVPEPVGAPCPAHVRAGRGGAELHTGVLRDTLGARRHPGIPDRRSGPHPELDATAGRRAARGDPDRRHARRHRHPRRPQVRLGQGAVIALARRADRPRGRAVRVGQRGARRRAVAAGGVHRGDLRAAGARPAGRARRPPAGGRDRERARRLRARPRAPPRSADRAGEPGAVRRAGRAGGRGGLATWPVGRSGVHGHRSLQADQRLARP